MNIHFHCTGAAYCCHPCEHPCAHCKASELPHASPQSWWDLLCVCVRHRDTLHALLYKLKKHVLSTHPEMFTSHANYRHLISPQIVQQMRMQKSGTSCQITSRLSREKFHKVTQQKGVEVNKELHSDLVSIAREN